MCDGNIWPLNEYMIYIERASIDTPVPYVRWHFPSSQTLLPLVCIAERNLFITRCGTSIFKKKKKWKLFSLFWRLNGPIYLRSSLHITKHSLAGEFHELSKFAIRFDSHDAINTVHFHKNYT